MNQRLTKAEIESRFESEWVLLDDPQLDEFHQVIDGVVLCHSKDRDEVYRKAVELRPRRSAMMYTGSIPENTAIVLGPSPSRLSGA